MTNIDLESWMTNLPPALRQTPLIYLAIPGSHDSTTYGISPASSLSPDAEPILKKLSFLGGFLKQILTIWSVTQSSTVRDQLYKGIRYFDLRLATKEDKDLYYFVHGMYSEEVSVELEEIKSFIKLHPKEVVILDCQHFYGFKDYDHKRFKELLTTMFAKELLSYTSDLKSVTLDSMTDESTHPFPIIVIYRESPTKLEETFWPPESFPNPWADTMSVSSLINFLTSKLKERDYSYGYVSQCILTPSVTTILLNLCSTLKNRCFLPLEQEKYKWLNAQTPGPQGINIVISDFVYYRGDNFAKTVIALNEKLLVGNTAKIDID